MSPGERPDTWISSSHEIPMKSRGNPHEIPMFLVESLVESPLEPMVSSVSSLPAMPKTSQGDV